jgi:hypothetical protein
VFGINRGFIGHGVLFDDASTTPFSLSLFFFEVHFYESLWRFPLFFSCYSTDLDIRRLVFKAFRICVVFSLIVSIGAHWAFLQSAAWLGMVVTYTLETGSLNQGISDTFDGNHPCQLCVVVKKGQQEQKKKTPSSSRLKDLKLVLHDSQVTTLALMVMRRDIVPDQVALQHKLQEEPALPPPRVIS